MKKAIIIFCMVIIAGCYSKKPKSTTLTGKIMPPISLLGFDSTTVFHTDSIKTGKPTLLFYFAASCPFCRAETRMLISDKQPLSDFNIVMVCVSKFSEFKKFYSKFDLQNHRSIQAGVDANDSFKNYFATTQVPYLVIYDKNKKLKCIYLGKTSPATIKKAVST
ncbi:MULTISPECIES: TlpA family protein disulfide reductase [Niastella]|uniref:Redoxin domain-containing protein n=1 Tax=Niastella soli TaxID=2821487 RepID=A0ABS3Z3A9_9BACT|nr:thioredoxin-like domain-containing protein [Niastella soli]MBO9204649.1 redoxin domain-containing protein [Niastella soli]